MLLDADANAVILGIIIARTGKVAHCEKVSFLLTCYGIAVSRDLVHLVVL